MSGLPFQASPLDPGEGSGLARKHVDRQIRLFPLGGWADPDEGESPPEESRDWDAVMRDLRLILSRGRFEAYLARQRPGDDE